MRRRRTRSHLVSFGYGVGIASVAALAMVGVHSLIAPPLPDNEAVEAVSRQARIAGSEQGVIASPGIERWAKPAVSAPIPVTPAPPTLVALPAPVSSGEAQRSLARNIQRELARVGCFTGEIDGQWTTTTRAAMKAFNDTIRVQLPVTGPDYILLTLLQGHATKACGVDPAVHAKAPVNSVARPTASAPVPAPVSIVEVPRPVAVQPNVAARPGVPKPDMPAIPETATRPAPSQIPTLAVAPAPPLPGRMSVGAPPVLIEPPAQAEQARITAPRLESPPKPAARPSRATPVAAPAPAPAPRSSNPRYTNPTRSIFGDVSRNAP